MWNDAKKTGDTVMRGNQLSLMVLVLWAGLVAFATHAQAGKADVIAARLEPMKDGSFVVVATIRHHDESFAHFANRFDVVAPDGKVIAVRPLVHPHIDEQPFTRALARVKIPKGIKEITVRAHDKLHGFGGLEKVLKVPGR